MSLEEISGYSSTSLNHWVPLALNLRDGLPFTYSESAVSHTSATEAFITGINQRDNSRCIVCGEDDGVVLEYAHIIPRGEVQTWEDLRARHFIPNQTRSVMREGRNGILLCRTHRGQFDGFRFYLRWVPEARRFVLINHSGKSSLQAFHGRAVRLFPGSGRLPFHGAFLIHEMRVRGFWPFANDPIIPLPIPWQAWIQDGPDGAQPDDNGDNAMRSHDVQGSKTHFHPLTNVGPSTSRAKSGRVGPKMHSADTGPPRTLTLTNPFAKPVDLEILKRSFHEQPISNQQLNLGRVLQRRTSKSGKAVRGAMSNESCAA
ncbi:hypothetical protein BS47DRAFT_1333211 [Hydnum rufescens UP504]|uniref:HNH nuclease domain-containing protein n=1 Tax=Hydnum rufescens UP504 TaxID=1448309 RepID=A0A9P6AKJ9_9AGAM|nr:hypothetical protein BS47DRAFT_1333211 [Hydnum rufescens UP504]